MNLSRTSIPDLAVLQAFEAAARHGNFTRAAAELNLTQSAVSRQIRALEDQLGVALFERVRKRVHLSATGRLMLSDVQRLLALLEEIVLRARASADGKTVLSIATLPTFGSRWLMARLGDFVEKHQGIAVNVVSRAEPFDLKAEDIDLAIHYGQPVWANAVCTYLCSEVILPVVSPTVLKTGTLHDPKDLETKPLLHLATRPKLWAEWYRLNGLDSEQAFRGNRFDHFAMIIEATVRGMGVALLPTYLIENELAVGSLQIALDLPLTTEYSYYVVLPEGKKDSALAQTFQAWLLEQVGNPVAASPAI